MNISLDISDRLSLLKIRKSRTKVGIFGSYIRFEELSRIKNHLNNEIGFLSYLADDLNHLFPKTELQTDNSYNRYLSEKLVELSDIHLFFFFKNSPDESEINQSVVSEIRYLYDMTKPCYNFLAEYVIVYVQKGVKIRSLLMDLIENRGSVPNCL